MMDLDRFLRDFEQTVAALPGHFAKWPELEEYVRDGFFEELIHMVIMRSRAERVALEQGRIAEARKLARLHGRLLQAVAEGGQIADINPSDLMPDVGEFAPISLCTDNSPDTRAA